LRDLTLGVSGGRRSVVDQGKVVGLGERS